MAQPTSTVGQRGVFCFFFITVFCVKKRKKKCDLSLTTSESQHLVFSLLPSLLLAQIIPPLLSRVFLLLSFLPSPRALLLKTHLLHKSNESSGGYRIITMSVQHVPAGASELIKSSNLRCVCQYNTHKYAQNVRYVNMFQSFLLHLFLIVSNAA